MIASRTARALLVAATCTVAACHGRNDGNSDPYGGSSNGAGGSPPPGPRAGQSTDTTTAPLGAPVATAAPGARGRLRPPGQRQDPPPLTRRRP